MVKLLAKTGLLRAHISTWLRTIDNDLGEIETLWVLIKQKLSTFEVKLGDTFDSIWNAVWVDPDVTSLFTSICGKWNDWVNLVVLSKVLYCFLSLQSIIT